MFPWIGRTASACWKPVRRYARMTRDEDDDTSNSSDGGDDRSQWSRDLEKHFAGEFSFSVVQGNAELEDHSQVETGPNAVFVGVYDGHGGPEAARFVRENLFLHHMRFGSGRKCGMFPWIGRTASACWKPVRRYARMTRDEDDDTSNSSDGGDDRSQWSRDLEKHFAGEFSFSVVQGNAELEDHSQVETGPNAVFVGVYDGHGGPEAARFVRENLFLHLMKLAQEAGTMSEDVISKAFSATEEGFLSLVRRTFGSKQKIAAVGSCCLVGIISKETLYVACLGDSRAVIGYEDKSNNIVAEQLSKEHNASFEEVREELRSLHPDDPDIVVKKNKAWRVKGIIQVTRSIGDAYLKRPEFALDESFPRFHLPEPLTRPALLAEPTLCCRNLGPNDKFLIFASDGLWDHMTNQQAVDIVFNNPRTGIARKLIRSALNKAAVKNDMSYEEIKQIEQWKRRCIHDDITVIVIFIDHELLEKKISVPEQSIRGFIDTVGPSHFSILKGINASTDSGDVVT